MLASKSLPLAPQRRPSVGRRASPSGRVHHVIVCKAHKICVLPGDGIGPEIMSVATKALTAAGQKEGEEFEYMYELIGGAAIDATGSPLPDKTLATAKASDAVLLAAIGGYKWDSYPNEIRPEKGLLKIRSELNAFANLRPAIVPKQEVFSSCQKNRRTSDVIFIEWLVERIARVAFEAARKRNKRLCSVEKSNVLEVSQLWKEVVTKLGKDYPDVELTHMYVDNAAMQLVRNPKYFDVVVTSNLFGDILSDEASMLAGSLGMLPSASISGDGPGIYEPVHGSAPDIAGQDIANPMAMMLSAAMMCRYDLDCPKVSDRLEAAVSQVLDEGLRTGDIFKEGYPNTRKVKCSELSEHLLRIVSA
ncbi:3-Isopropylmalate dehydrogenase [Dunaliella salina]|uniref:3-isopropylmalate dehydrogenase n=1 Tax=Dunaliella salina TaxID=3046 RepID=A0ABQ7GNC4_DUNSA|nr:3-Isopropylmalate dehydrogenase [Dunaliella salina]|eukprot:KAF5836112.1 3-Isopropylmalate dehydrogenase [Dunaliella salina]